MRGRRCHAADPQEHLQFNKIPTEGTYINRINTKRMYPTCKKPTEGTNNLEKYQKDAQRKVKYEGKLRKGDQQKVKYEGKLRKADEQKVKYKGKLRKGNLQKVIYKSTKENYEQVTYRR